MSKYLEKEIYKILKDLHGITEDELNQNSKTIVEITADIIQAKLSEIKDLNDEIGKLRVDNVNKQIMIDDLQESNQYMKSELKRIYDENVEI